VRVTGGRPQPGAPQPDERACGQGLRTGPNALITLLPPQANSWLFDASRATSRRCNPRFI
jgi:hypothetical protein